MTSQIQLCIIDEGMKLGPGIHGSLIALCSFTNLTVSIQLGSMQVVNHEERHLAVVFNKLLLEKLRYFLRVAILASFTSLWAILSALSSIVNVVRFQVPSMRSGNDQIGSIRHIGWAS